MEYDGQRGARWTTLGGPAPLREHREDRFTDSSGFVYGTQQVSYSDVGARARLMAVVPDRGFAWMPFVGATFDRALGLSDTFDIPAQAAAIQEGRGAVVAIPRGAVACPVAAFRACRGHHRGTRCSGRSPRASDCGTRGSPIAASPRS